MCITGFSRIWGCQTFVDQLQSDKVFFVGYAREILGYYFYNREKSEVFVTRNGVFLEKQFLSRKDSGSKVQIEEI
jgi:hypothetical protein